MGFLDRFKKQVPATLDEAGRHLLSVSMKDVEGFLNKNLPEICSDLDVELDSYDQSVLRAEVMIANVWAATKALEGEERELIDAVHNAFFQAFDDETRDRLKDLFYYRCDRYGEAWDGNSGVDQPALSSRILAEILYEGEFDESVLDSFAAYTVQAAVFSTIQDVRTARKGIRLTG